MRKRRVVRKLYSMEYSWKGHKYRNRHKNRITRSGQARLVYVKNINCSISNTWRWAHASPGLTSRADSFFFFFVRYPFRLQVTTVACKRPRSFCQKRRWQVTAKYVHTLDPTKLGWADFLSKHCVGAYQGNGLTCNCRLSSLSQCGLIPGLKSEMDVRGLISLKKKKKRKKEKKRSAGRK